MNATLASPALPVIRTASDLKYQVESAGRCPHFFSRASLKFFGDRMANYGIRKPAPLVCGYGESRRTVQTIELYRRRPVKHGLQSSAFFDAVTFERVFPAKD
jgi:hypothetical protein